MTDKTLGNIALLSFASLLGITLMAAPANAATSKARGHVYTITGEELSKSGHVFLVEALRGLPGVSIQGAAQPGLPVYVSLRGARSRYTLVLIDGIEVNAPVGPGYAANGTYNSYNAVVTPAVRGGAYNFAHLLTSDVERVEIIRGAVSALYGSGAGGGVINIVTTSSKRENAPKGLKFSFEGGTYDTLAAGFGFNLSGENVTGGFRGSFYRSINEDATSTGIEENDPYSNRSFSAGLSMSESFGDIKFNISQNYGNYDFDFYNFTNDNLGDDSVINSNHVQTRNSAVLEYSGPIRFPFFGKTTHGFTAYRHNDRVESSYSGADVIPSENYNYIRVGGDYSLDLGAFDVRIGFEEESYGDAHYNNKIYYGAEYIGRFFDTDVQIAVRNDQRLSERAVEVEGEDDSEVSYYIGLVRDIAGIAFHASYGQSVNEPNLVDFAQPDYADVPLSPETITQFDIGAGFDLPAGIRANVTYFMTEAEDPFYYEPGGTSPDDEQALRRRQQINIDTTGIEGSFAIPLSALAWTLGMPGTISLDATITYILDSQDINGNDVEATDVPELAASANFIWKLSDVSSVQVSAQYEGERTNVKQTTPTEDDPEVADYFLLGARFTYQLEGGANVYVRGENLLDEDYETVTSYQSRGLGVFFGISSTF